MHVPIGLFAIVKITFSLLKSSNQGQSSNNNLFHVSCCHPRHSVYS